MREAPVNVLIESAMTPPPDPTEPPSAPPRTAAERYLDLWERHLSLTARDGRLRQNPPGKRGDDAPE